MTAINLETITDAVINHGDKGASNPRLHEIYSSFVKHIHAFQKEVNLTTDELDIARQFIFDLAKPSQDFPFGEIQLMTDCLGISEVSILLDDAGNEGSTEMNVEGPLYIPGLPVRQSGDSTIVDENEKGEPLFINHTVKDTDGNVIEGAEIDIWQPNGEGFYFVQREHLPEWNCYGRFYTDAQGQMDFKTIVPGDYPIPVSGPTGTMLSKLGRHEFRACHIHYIIRAKGHEDFTTMMYFNHSDYVDSDTIFSVKDFRVDLIKHDSPEEMAEKGVDRAFYSLDYTFILP